VVKNSVVSEVVMLKRVVPDVERGLDMEGVPSEEERSRLWLIGKRISLELLHNSRLTGEM